MSAATIQGPRPSRLLKAVSRLREEAEHLEHYRLHVEHPTSRSVPDADSGQGPFSVKFVGPRMGREPDSILALWGVPTTIRDLDAVSHFHRGGLGLFELPRLGEVFAYGEKVAKHRDAATYLHLLARVSLCSQLALSEAMLVVGELMHLDRLAAEAPRERASDWARVGLAAVDIWHRRHLDGGDGIGDVVALADRLDVLRRTCGEWQVRQMEMDLAERRQKLIGGAS